jgi:hypothetical protein
LFDVRSRAATLFESEMLGRIWEADKGVNPTPALSAASSVPRVHRIRGSAAWRHPFDASLRTAERAHFAGAFVGHVRVKDVKGLGPALVPLVLAIAALALRIVTV